MAGLGTGYYHPDFCDVILGTESYCTYLDRPGHYGEVVYYLSDSDSVRPFIVGALRGLGKKKEEGTQARMFLFSNERCLGE